MSTVSSISDALISATVKRSADGARSVFAQLGKKTVPEQQTVRIYFLSSEVGPEFPRYHYSVTNCSCTDYSVGTLVFPHLAERAVNHMYR